MMQWRQLRPEKMWKVLQATMQQIKNGVAGSTG